MQSSVKSYGIFFPSYSTGVSGFGIFSPSFLFPIFLQITPKTTFCLYASIKTGKNRAKTGHFLLQFLPKPTCWLLPLTSCGLTCLFSYFPQYCIRTTVSTCPVNGNMSNGLHSFASYPCFVKYFTSRASVSGLQET